MAVTVWVVLGLLLQDVTFANAPDSPHHVEADAQDSAPDPDNAPARLLMQASALDGEARVYFSSRDLELRHEKPEEQARLQAFYDELISVAIRVLNHPSATPQQKIEAIALWESANNALWTRKLTLDFESLNRSRRERAVFNAEPDQQRRLEFQSSVLASLAIGLGLTLPDATREALRDMVHDEYHGLLSTPVDDERFLALVEHFPFFMSVYLGGLNEHGVEVFRHSFRWHFWRATAFGSMTEAERRAILAREDAFATELADLFTDVTQDARVGEVQAARWREFAQALSHNPYWPFFKAREHEERWPMISQDLVSQIPEQFNIFANKPADHETDPDVWATYHKRLASLVSSIRYDVTFFRFGHRLPGSCRYLPNDLMTTNSIGTQWRDTYIPVLVISGVKPGRGQVSVQQTQPAP